MTEQKTEKTEKMKKGVMALDQLGEYEAGKGIDVEEYEGQRCTLKTAEIVEVEQIYDPITGDTSKDKEGNYIKHKVNKIRVVSEPVAQVEVKGEMVDIRASQLFNMKLVDGKWCVSTSPKADINKFLEKLKLPTGLEGVKQIGGQSVLMKKVTDGQQRDWLSYVY